MRKQKWLSLVKNPDNDEVIKKLLKQVEGSKQTSSPKEVPKHEFKKKDKEEGEKEEATGDNGTVLTAPRNIEAYQRVQELELENFDFESVSLDSMVMVVGKRRYGKTVWTEWLLSHLYEFFPRGGFVFTNTKQNYFWQKHFPENRVYGGVFPDVIQEILRQQKMLYESIMLGAQVDVSPFVCIVLDDVITSKEIRHNPLIQELAWAGRHYFVFCVICCQDIKGVPPGFRGNADLIALTYQTQNRTMETVTLDFADIWDNKYVFPNLIKKYTKEHGMLVIDQTTAKFDMNEMFYKDKAPDPDKTTTLQTDSFGPIKVKGPVFKIGSDEFWARSQNNWMVQLFKAQNIPSSKRDKWAKKLEEAKKDPKVQELLEEDFDPKRKDDPFNEEETGKQSLDAAQPLKETRVSEFEGADDVPFADEGEAEKELVLRQQMGHSLESRRNQIMALRQRQQ